MTDPSELDRLVEELKQAGLKAAEAEAEYYKVKNMRVLVLKAEGMPATVIEKVIKGEDDVNIALLDYRRKEVLYRAAQEALNVGKIQVREGGNIARAEYYAN